MGIAPSPGPPVPSRSRPGRSSAARGHSPRGAQLRDRAPPCCSRIRGPCCARGRRVVVPMVVITELRGQACTTRIWATSRARRCGCCDDLRVTTAGWTAPVEPAGWWVLAVELDRVADTVLPRASGSRTTTPHPLGGREPWRRVTTCVYLQGPPDARQGLALGLATDEYRAEWLGGDDELHGRGPAGRPDDVVSGLYLDGHAEVEGARELP
ncbi:hypothetical protein QJS66_08400 [Kocuria rhizophila]|nr:hypothetical protein QJS66_08400 [Kocuria rhizophila]